MIKILIVEDSPVMQELLAYTIGLDPEFVITGIASDGEEALNLIAKEKPHVIAMDWQMPKLNGLKATRKIMETSPIPIVIITGSLAVNDTAISFSLMEAGALAILKKPHGLNHPNFKSDAKRINECLKLMSEVRLVKRTVPKSKEEPPAKVSLPKNIDKEIEGQTIVIGASTGGPLVLQKILSGLPKNMSVPILIVQHITQDFVEGFVEWLAKTTEFPIHIPSNGDKLIAGHAYVAPDNFHMGVDRNSRIILSNHEKENNLRPAVSYLFKTAAESFGKKAIGVLLTGMGSDGAAELKALNDLGAITIAQNKESSVVHGMPGEAIRLDGAKYILSPEEIVKMLSLLAEK